MEREKLGVQAVGVCMRCSPVVSHTSRIPRFGARCWLRWVRRSDLGRSPLPPSFLSSSPANNRADGDWPSRKQAQGVGAARNRRRGHGPARLDGQATPATVAGSAMNEWKEGNPANGRRSDEPKAARRAPLRAGGTPGWRSANRAARDRPCAPADQAQPVRRYPGGAKPARRGGLPSRPLEWGAQCPPSASGEQKKRGLRPRD